MSMVVMVLAGCGRSAPADEVAGADPGGTVSVDQTESTDAQAPADTGSGATVAGGDPTQESTPPTPSSTPSTVAAETTTTLVIVPGAGSAVQGPNEAGVRVVSDGPIVAPPPEPQPGATPSTDPGSSRTYAVEPGDTMSGIAEKFGVPVAAIAQANGITDVDDIMPGQELIIPDPASEPPATAADQ